MSGNREGGKLAAKKNLEGDPGFYRRIGKIGGAAGKGPNYGGGFSAKTVGKDGRTGRERARIAGAIGGRTSRRGPSKKTLQARREAEARKRIAPVAQFAPQRQNVLARLRMSLRRKRGGERARV